MKYSTIAASLLLAGSAVAAPGTAMRRARAQAKRDGRAGNIMIPVEGQRGLVNESNAQVSSNWGGAVLVGTGYTGVTGSFVAPSPSTAGSGSAWVGIDGDTCGSAILQTGIDWTRSGSRTTYDVWFEWFPDFAMDFSGITVAAGQTIKATVVATSKTGGVATVENVSTGVTVSHTFSNMGSVGSLCEENAEWIVEDFESGGSQVSFADFGTLSFSGASATHNGATVGVTGATIIDMEPSNNVEVVCNTSGTSGVTCTYE